MSVSCRAASARQKALESLRKLKYYINMNWEILHVTQYITNQRLRRLHVIIIIIYSNKVPILGHRIHG